MKEILQTEALAFPGQNLPVPMPPPGDGWELITQQATKDERGKPILRWTWSRDLPEGEEWLTQNA